MIKNCKQFFYFLIIIVSLVLFATPVSANEASASQDIKVFLDGKQLSFEAQPVIINGTALVPVRVIFEALGAKVDWCADTRTVCGTKGDIKIHLIIDSTYAYINDRQIKLAVPSQLIDSRTFIPLRFIAESLGADVRWIGETRTVIINSPKAIKFEDPNLEAAVRDLLQKPYGEIMSYDVSSIKMLNIANKKIKNISGLQFFTALEDLNLCDNEIADLHPLEKLSNLNFLYLNNNKIKDISPLKDLSSLKMLQFHYNSIYDITALSQMDELVQLSMGDNPISDITPLSRLSSLMQLFMWNTQVTDISPLKELKNITYLDLYNNSIIDISPLKNLKNLKALYIERYDKKQKIDDSLFKRYALMVEKADSIILSVIKPDMNDYEKELALHDYLITHVKYDKENEDTMSSESHSSVGFFEKGIAVCDGYAKAMKILLQKAGIESYVVTGRTLGTKPDEPGHAWNIVKIDGRYYHLDATWNDPCVNNSQGFLSHTYFNLSDKQILASHIFDNYKFPECTDNNPDYDIYISHNRNVLITEKWIFTTAKNVLYKIGFNGSSIEKLADDDAYDLNISGDWLYYRNASDNDSIYKLKIDGSGRKLISRDPSKHVWLKDKFIYYIHDQDGENRTIRRITTDGENKTVLFHSTLTTTLFMSGNTLYFKTFDWNTGVKLYRMNVDTGWADSILNDRMAGFNEGQHSVRYTFSFQEFYIGDWIYYINESDNSSIYKIKNNGSSKVKINSDSSSNMEICGDWIYYVNQIDNKYYRIRLNGEDRQLI